MTKPGNAGCLCGKLRLNITGDPVTVMQCHCADCQMSTGGGAVLFALLARKNVTIVSGTPRGHTVAGSSGHDVNRVFCGHCGSPLYSELGKYPDLLAVKSGVWDDDPGLVPTCAIWTASAPAWHRIPDDIPTFPGAPS